MRRRFYWLALFLIVGRGQGLAADRGSRLGSFLSGSINTFDYTFEVQPGQSGSPRILENYLQGSYVVSRTTDTAWSVSGRAGQLTLSDSVVIPDSGLAIPTTLWSLQGGTGFVHQLANRRQWGANLGVGSDSDRLFYTIHETDVQATLHYERPSGGQNAWIFLLNYSNNRSFLNNIPLPGFAYVLRQPEKGLYLVAGFPFLALTYQPNRLWSARFSLFGPTQVSAEVARRIWGPVRLYVGYNRHPLLWLRTQRDDYSNRLIYDEKKVSAGLRTPLGHGLSLELSGGWQFDRRFFESKDANHSNVARASLPNSPFFESRLSFRWGREKRHNE